MVIFGYMKEIAPGIIIDPNIQSGKPVIKGTRVPVEVIVGQVAAGDPIEEVAQSYLITKNDVLAALQFASRLVSNQRIRAVP